MVTNNSAITKSLGAAITGQRTTIAKPLHLQMSRAARLVWSTDNSGQLKKIAGKHRCLPEQVSQIFHAARRWDKKRQEWRDLKAAKISASIDRAIRESKGLAADPPDAEPKTDGAEESPPEAPRADRPRLAVAIPPATSQLSLKLAGDGMNEAFRRGPGKANDPFAGEQGDAPLSRRDVEKTSGVALATVQAWFHGEPVSEESDSLIRQAIRRLSFERIQGYARRMAAV